MSLAISIKNTEARLQTRNLVGATVNAPGAELAESSTTKEIVVFLVSMAILFIGALCISPVFCEAVLESVVMIVTLVIGVVVLLGGMVGIHWFTNTPSNINAIASRVAVALLIAGICYMYPIIVFLLLLAAAVAWTVMTYPESIRCF